MTSAPDAVLQLTVEVDREASGELDSWLSGFMEETLALPGFASAASWVPDDDSDRTTRVVSIDVDDEARLQAWLDQPLRDTEAELQEIFGERTNLTLRILRHSDAGAADSAPVERCMNCDAVLTGQYCGQCGQRAQNRLIKLPELLRDAIGDLFEFDSRLWRTLVPLAVRPGLLTKDYLRGRRARYMPPFRMYLILSLAFFLIAFFDPQERLGILFEPEAATIDGPAPEVEDTDAATEAPAAADDSPVRIEIGDGDEVSDCSFDNYDASDMPAWLSRRLTKERVVSACENVFADGEQGIRALLGRMVENIPAGLFILLPLMALVLMILHPLSGRYYVEHLLLIIHYHSFVFLILTLDILFARLVAATPLPGVLGNVATLLTVIYIPVYLYKSMRRVYERGRLVTALRFLVMAMAYFTGLCVIVGIAALLAAFSP